jgi:integrase
LFSSIISYKNHEEIISNFYLQSGSNFAIHYNQSWSKPDAFRRHWFKILEAACINYRNPHQMRHTFISFMLMMGNRPEVLYKIVGHQNTEMIYKVYGKFIKGENQQKKLLVM